MLLHFFVSALVDQLSIYAPTALTPRKESGYPLDRRKFDPNLVQTRWYKLPVPAGNTIIIETIARLPRT